VIERLIADLPVFGIPFLRGTILYTPGRMAVAEAAEPGCTAIPRAILEEASAAVERWQALAQSPFRPVCLTLNLTSRCSLKCGYCFARNAGRGSQAEDLALPAIRAAARLVAGFCAAANKPFQIVFSGGGEPAEAWTILQAAIEETRALAQAQGLEWRSYLATNGSLPEARLRWLARNIGKIGLSCDGPPDIHNLQRPGTNSHPSLPQVERAAAIIREEGGNFSVRATIAPLSSPRQAEIVRWLHQRLGAREIRFEPVYCAPAGSGFRPEDAGRFVSSFLAAQRVTRELGAGLSLSGVRLDEFHGPHCNVLKDVLQLRPDGTATNCFLAANADTPQAAIRTIGSFDPATGEYRLDHGKIAELRRQAAALPPRCLSCLNVYHCARSCPDTCLVDSPGSAEPDFRCRVARSLAVAWLLEAGGRRRGKAPGASVRSLPVPLWARRGFTWDGAEAWRRIAGYLRQAPGDRPMSVYVHVPFCRSRCGFCDCYAEAAGNQSSPGIGRFEADLLSEIDAWSAAGALGAAPVTTVHFGGGTPNCLPGALGAAVARIRNSLAIAPETEWALESTTSLLSHGHLQWLRELGFTRLHVGIQTLEDDVRRSIGRRESAEASVLRLADALQMGFIVSVDLIYGLPGQKAAGWLATLDTLAGLGIDGVSLYSLQTTARNRNFLARLAAPVDSEERFALFQAACQSLSARGYRKNHFAHFAASRDANLYYRHALRGENLLALGPSADGCMGPFLYRQAQLAGGFPALAGALEMTGPQARARAAEAELMANAISWELFESLGVSSLLCEWQAMGLLEPDAAGLRLSTTGSWEIGGMLDALSGRVMG
jgi:oxygen-independent coproporphyrinogen-3 oxidase